MAAEEVIFAKVCYIFLLFGSFYGETILSYSQCMQVCIEKVSAKMTNRERSVVTWSRIVVLLSLIKDVYFHTALLRFVAANLSQKFLISNYSTFF